MSQTYKDLEKQISASPRPVLSPFSSSSHLRALPLERFFLWLLGPGWLYAYLWRKLLTPLVMESDYEGNELCVLGPVSPCIGLHTHTGMSRH
jgi:hypothetical protein